MLIRDIIGGEDTSEEEAKFSITELLTQNSSVYVVFELLLSENLLVFGAADRLKRVLRKRRIEWSTGFVDS